MVNFWETYSPVVNGTTIRLHLILAPIHQHNIHQIVFVLAYPQANVECDIYMDIPQGFDDNGKRNTHVVHLFKMICGTGQAGHILNKHIHTGLMEQGCHQSMVDHCVYYKRLNSLSALCWWRHFCWPWSNRNWLTDFLPETRSSVPTSMRHQQQRHTQQ
jgi:hypothetical protein